MSNLLIGILSLLIAFFIFILSNLIRKGIILKNSIIIVDMLHLNYRWQPRWITIFIILLCLTGFYFLWQENFWFVIISVGIIYLINMFLSSLKSDGFKATKIFNLYKRIKSMGIDKAENDILLRTARAYYIYKKLPKDYIDMKVAEINATNVLELSQWILNSEDDYSNSSFSMADVEKRNKVIRFCYRKVFKKEPYF